MRGDLSNIARNILSALIVIEVMSSNYSHILFSLELFMLSALVLRTDDSEETFRFSSSGSSCSRLLSAFVGACL